MKIEKSGKIMFAVLSLVLVAGPVWSVAGAGLMGEVSLNGDVTRLELSKMLSKVLANAKGDDLTQYDCVPFSDLSANEWYSNYVCYMYENDVIKGSPDGTFKPFSSVNRAEAAKFYWKVFSLANGDIEKQGDLKPYSDVSEGEWYFDYVRNAGAAGILDVKPFKGYKFFPANSLTKGRAQYWTKNLEKALEVF